MNIMFTDQSWRDYLYWQQTDKKTHKRINILIREIKRMPFEGIGKPEPLKFNLSGYWSRKISEEHRIVYKFESDCICIVSVRHHYS